NSLFARYTQTAILGDRGMRVAAFRGSNRFRKKRCRLNLIELESRITPATDVLQFHNNAQGTGVNSDETDLTRALVNYQTFGRLFQLPVDGQVYAQPLVKRNVNITTGPYQGVHDVVFVATEHDSLYAIDAGTLNGVNQPTTLGEILWQRSFLAAGLPG